MELLPSILKLLENVYRICSIVLIERRKPLQIHIFSLLRYILLVDKPIK